jgi:hypothetical protein
MRVIATPGAVTTDPPDQNTLFTGLPNQYYTVTIKVRGVAILKPYDKLSWALPGSSVTCNPVPPAATVPQSCFQFTGALDANGIVRADETIEWKLLIDDPNNPTAVYCLNMGTPVVLGGLIGVPQPLDYTFDMPITTDSSGNSTFTLTSRTGSLAGVKSTAGNVLRYKIDDDVPPLLASVQAIQGTKYVWMQIDVMAAV